MTFPQSHQLVCFLWKQSVKEGHFKHLTDTGFCCLIREQLKLGPMFYLKCSFHFIAPRKQLPIRVSHKLTFSQKYLKTFQRRAQNEVELYEDFLQIQLTAKSCQLFSKKSSTADVRLGSKDASVMDGKNALSSALRKMLSTA